MNTLFLVVWLACTGIGNCNLFDECSCIQNKINSQTVSTEEELNKLYQEHKDDGVRVFKVEKSEIWLIPAHDKCWVGNYIYDQYTSRDFAVCATDKKITELEFSGQPCGKWVEKK